MSPISEIDAIKTLDDTLSQLEDSSTRDRVLQWAWDKYATKQKPQSPNSATEKGGHRKKTIKAKPSNKAKTTAKNKSGLSIIKDLNLSPSGKKVFKKFAEEKEPSANNEKCAVSIYYLRHELELDNVSVNHIFTCYKNVGWRVPADLYNIIAVTASRNGWLDTSDMNNIKLTPHGENLIEFDLPKKNKTKQR